VVEPAAGDTTGIPIRRKRILEGFHLGATPAGVGCKTIQLPVVSPAGSTTGYDCGLPPEG